MLGHFHIMQLTCTLYVFTTSGCFNVLLISVWLRVRHRQPGRLHLRPNLRPLRHQDRPENFVQQRGLPPGHLRPLLRLLGLHRKCQLVHRVVLPAQVRKFGGHCGGGGWSITPLLTLGSGNDNCTICPAQCKFTSTVCLKPECFSYTSSQYS